MGLLLRTDLLAKDRSAVTRVIEILQQRIKNLKKHLFKARIPVFCVHDVILSFLQTFPQICVSGSRKELSASCPSPRQKNIEKSMLLYALD